MCINCVSAACLRCFLSYHCSGLLLAQTILIFLSIYTAGLLTITIVSATPSAPTTLIGLLLVGVATGGIKPTVTPFGADQFPAGSLSDVNKYVLTFYFLASVGTLISFVSVPLLRYVNVCFA